MTMALTATMTITLKALGDRDDADNEQDDKLVRAELADEKAKAEQTDAKKKEQKNALKVNDDASRKVSKKPASFVQKTFHTIKDPRDKCFTEIPIKTRVYGKDNKVIDTKVEWKLYCTVCSRSYKPMDAWKRNRHCESRPH